MLAHRGALHLLRKEYEAAVSDASGAIAINDKDAVPFRVRGFARMRMKDYGGALDDFDKAATLNPLDAEVLAAAVPSRSSKGDYNGSESRSPCLGHSIESHQLYHACQPGVCAQKDR